MMHGLMKSPTVPELVIEIVRSGERDPEAGAYVCHWVDLLDRYSPLIDQRDSPAQTGDVNRDDLALLGLLAGMALIALLMFWFLIWKAA